MIAANAPDVDVFALLVDPYFGLAFRRGITHGWPALLVLPFAVAASMLFWDRLVRRRRRRDLEPARFSSLLLLSAVGVATHPTLDWMNSYGMRWRMPFDGSWSYGDALFIIDPWIWLALGGALFLSRRRTSSTLLFWTALAALTTAVVLLAPVSGWVRGAWLGGVAGLAWAGSGRGRRSEHGGRPSRATDAGRADAPRGGRVARAALVLTVVYAFGLVAANRAARGEVGLASDDSGLEALDIMIQPLPGTPLRGEIEIRTPEGYVPGTHDWLRRPRVVLHPERLVPRFARPDALADTLARKVVDEARRDPRVRDYLVWSRYPVVSVEPEGAAWRVRFGDARYDGRASGSLGGVDVVVALPEHAP